MHEKTVLGACPHDCPDTCSLVTTVVNGVATRVQGNAQHPMTGGVLCAKVSKYTERTYHPERVLTPLRRSGPKGSGQFEPVSWDEALADIAQRLHHIAQRNPEAILPYSYAGTMGRVQGESMDRRFFHQLGASLLDRTICASAGSTALQHTYGGKLGMRVEFFAESKLILIWGSNSMAAICISGALRRRPSATAPSSSALTPVKARRRTSAMRTCSCCRARTQHWRWR